MNLQSGRHRWSRRMLNWFALEKHLANKKFVIFLYLVSAVRFLLFLSFCCCPSSVSPLPQIDVPVRAEKTIMAELTPSTALSSPPLNEVDRQAKEKLADAEKEKVALTASYQSLKIFFLSNVTGKCFV